MHPSRAALPLTIRAAQKEGFRRDDLVDVHEWRDLDDRICARGYTGSDASWMDWPGVAAFRFDDTGHIEAFVEPGISHDRVVDLCRRTVEPLVLQALGQEVLHASAVRTPRGIVAFCADRGTGKSTIAYSLSRRGIPQHSDDSIVMDVAVDAVRVVGLPFGVRLRPEAAAFYGFAADPMQLLHDVVPLDAASGSRWKEPLAAIFVLARTEAGPPVATRLAPAEAFPAMLTHAHCFDLTSRDVRRRVFDHYLSIAALVPIFALRFSPGLDRIGDVLDCIEQTIEQIPQAQSV